MDGVCVDLDLVNFEGCNSFQQDLLNERVEGHLKIHVGIDIQRCNQDLFDLATNSVHLSGIQHSICEDCSSFCGRRKLDREGTQSTCEDSARCIPRDSSSGLNQSWLNLACLPAPETAQANQPKIVYTVPTGMTVPGCYRLEGAYRESAVQEEASSRNYVQGNCIATASSCMAALYYS